MSESELLGRIERLERSFLTFASMVVGELLKDSTPEETKLAILTLGSDMKQMAVDCGIRK